MVLLDTTFLSDVIRKRPEALRALDELRREGARPTTVNLAELYAGAFRLPDPVARLQAVERIVEALVLVDFDARAARTFGELEALLAGRGDVIPTKDLLIASVALSHGEQEVLTRNQKDFARVPGIVVRPY